MVKILSILLLSAFCSSNTYAEVLPHTALKAFNTSIRQYTENTSTHTDPQIVKLIKDLGDDSFPIRENASNELLKLGESIVPPLIQGRNTEDAEVRLRIDGLLEKFAPQKLAELKERDAKKGTENWTIIIQKDGKEEIHHFLAKNTGTQWQIFGSPPSFMANYVAFEFSNPRFDGDVGKIVWTRLLRNGDETRIDNEVNRILQLERNTYYLGGDSARENSVIAVLRREGRNE